MGWGGQVGADPPSSPGPMLCHTYQRREGRSSPALHRQQKLLGKALVFTREPLAFSGEGWSWHPLYLGVVRGLWDTGWQQGPWERQRNFLP